MLRIGSELPAVDEFIPYYFKIWSCIIDLSKIQDVSLKTKLGKADSLSGHDSFSIHAQSTSCTEK